MPPSSSQPLSILLVASGLPPEHVGGVEQHVGGLARELSARGHQVELVANALVKSGHVKVDKAKEILAELQREAATTP